METRAKVLIVDDQTLYREGLRSIIARWPEFEVTGMVRSGEDAVRFCQHHAPDLVLMDVSMPGMGGVRAVSLIREALPDAIIVMLTVSADDEDVYGALHSGAGGYVLKDVPPEHLRTYMQAALRGQVSLSGVVATKFVKRAVVNPPKLAGVSVFADSKKELSEGERGSIYEACMKFVQTYMDSLADYNYDARIGAVCWMQGESDTTDFKASHYYENQMAFAAYLREDLAPYAEEGEIGRAHV